MSYTLKYLFTAEFADGTSYRQTPDDTPRIADHGSSFTDLSSRVADIVSFSLSSVADAAQVLSVDLRDGSFTINGLRFPAQTPHGIPFQLVYFRQVTRSLVSGSSEESIHVSYHIGWRTAVTGCIYQQTVSVE